MSGGSLSLLGVTNLERSPTTVLAPTAVFGHRLSQMPQTWLIPTIWENMTGHIMAPESTYLKPIHLDLFNVQTALFKQDAFLCIMYSLLKRAS